MISLSLRSALTLFLCAFSTWASAASALPRDPALDFGLVPHRAIYDINLASSRSGSQIVNISGEMYYEWQPACDGWISNHRYNLTYEYADTPPEQVVSDFTSFEGIAPHVFSFSSQRRVNGVVVEELRGKTDSTGPVLKAQYKMPSDLNFDLPEGAMFPTGHSLSVLQDIRAGKRLNRSIVFDGSDTAGPVAITSFWSGAVHTLPTAIPASLREGELLRAPAHQVHLAFFPLNSDEAIADYEMSLVFHENGIISAMSVDYGSFSVKQTLKALERLPGSCENTAKAKKPKRH
ncbi:MAG: cell envelope integrity EipB family protein [Alphaproteobacteria bacterium]|nr:cell envelope integrity EipB family protein [Alphaproteobacteria bacterium]